VRVGGQFRPDRLELCESLLGLAFALGNRGLGWRTAGAIAGMRMASAGAAGIWLVGLLVVLRRGGLQVWSPLADRWARAAVWIFAAYAAFMVLANAASPSGIERAVMTPSSVVLAVTCALIARWGAAPSPLADSRSR